MRVIRIAEAGVRSTIICLLFVFTLVMSGEPVAAKVWHVCMRCGEQSVQSIEEALRQAQPRDTILVYWEPEFPYYMEHLVIDKPVRIISNAAAGDIPNYDLYPVITTQAAEIVRITVPGVELIGFNLTFLQKPRDCVDKAGCYNDSVGIRLEAPAIIQHCAITNCTTGILAEYRSSTLQTGSTIQRCRIGIPADHGINPVDLNQISNHFGLVLLGCRLHGPGLGSGTDSIRDCQIVRNTLYGVVYTPSNEPDLSGNLIDYNGEGPFRVALPGLDVRNRLVWLNEPPESDSKATSPVDSQ